MTKRNELFGKVGFLENYGMNVARHLISGADVWLNNPRRPLEASGTSGQKVSVHGGLNLSVLDGWWREGYDGTNGWAIGGEKSAGGNGGPKEAGAGFPFGKGTQGGGSFFFLPGDQRDPRAFVAKNLRAMRAPHSPKKTHAT